MSAVFGFQNRYWLFVFGSYFFAFFLSAERIDLIDEHFKLRTERVSTTRGSGWIIDSIE